MTARRQGLLEVRHPFFRPPWRRAVVTGLCLFWALFEILNGQVFWAILFGACGLYLLWQFFVKFDPADYEENPDSDAP